MLELERANLDDPNSFCEFTKNLRSTKKCSIPREIYEKYGGIVTTDAQKVLDRWNRDFRSLGTPQIKVRMSKYFCSM